MRVLSFVAAIVALTVTAAAAPAAAKPIPAVWSPHMVIVNLKDLPRRYTCDELWYKFKSVLLALGARADIKILPYRCEHALGSAAYSPQVQLQFSSPRVLSGQDARWSDLQVVSSSVRLQPGSPQRLDAGDCDLLNQIRSSLLPYLGDPVTAFNLACQAPRTAATPFGLTVTVLMPASRSGS